MSALVLVGLCGVACYLLRIVPVELLGRIETPGWLDRVAVLIAPVAFTALTVGALAGAASGGLEIVLPRVAGILVAVVVAQRTRSTSATIVTGMVTLWLASAAFAIS
jgi:branched-subunit amino acid transport protein